MPHDKTAKLSAVRKQNTSVILNQLRLHAPLSRAELSARTGLTRSTVSGIVSELIDGNLVRETELQRGEVGRPGMSLTLNPEGGGAVGIEIGVDFISIALANFTAQLLWQQRVPIDPQQAQSDIINQAETLIQIALDLAAKQGLLPLGIGLGLHGLVNFDRGLLIFAPNLHWRNIPFRALWYDRFGLPVMVENEANAAALGEYYFGVAREVNNFIYLSTGVGLGGGIFIGGKLFRGHTGYAGEVGHTKVKPDGEVCGCGQVGCLETLVSPRHIIRRVCQRLEQNAAGLMGTALPQVTFETIVQAAEQGDAVALEALQEAGFWLGFGLANLVNIFNPRLVILGGTLNQAGHLLIPIIERVVREKSLELPGEIVQIIASAHGLEACVMGAIALVLDAILREPAFSL